VVAAGVRVQAGPIDLEADPARWDPIYGFEIVDRLVEYRVDPSSPQVQKLLKRAYLPNFYSALEKGVPGVTPVMTNKSDQTGSGWRLKLLKFQRGDLDSTVRSTYDDLEDGDPVPTLSIDREFEHIRDGFRSSLRYAIGVRTPADSITKAAGAGGHSLWIRVRFEGSKARPDELREFLAMAESLKDLIPRAQLTRFESLRDFWKSAAPSERSSARFDFYLDLDSAALASILSGTDSDRVTRLNAAWREVTRGIPAEHDAQALKSFVEAVKKGLGETDQLRQALTFVHGLEHASFSLYPFASIVRSLPGRGHVLTSYRLITKPGHPEGTLDFTNAGGDFIPSSTVKVDTESADAP